MLKIAAPTKLKVNLAELAEVDAHAPEEIRRRAPLDVLKNQLYGLAFRKPALIEEAEYRFYEEAARRNAAPDMRAVRFSPAS